VSWTVEILNRSVASELDDLPDDIRARFYRIVELLETFGLSQVREPHNKHLEDKLWEMRMKGRDGIARAIYLAAHGQRLVVVHAFIKKTPRTPRGSLELARRRAAEGGFL